MSIISLAEQAMVANTRRHGIRILDICTSFTLCKKTITVAYRFGYQIHWSEDSLFFWHLCNPKVQMYDSPLLVNDRNLIRQEV